MKSLYFIVIIMVCAISGIILQGTKQDYSLSDMGKANVEALCNDDYEHWPCMYNPSYSCVEWIVLSCGVASPIYYSGFVNYQEKL